MEEGLRARVWVQRLVHRVILPPACDGEISRRDAETNEPISFENPLRSKVVQQRHSSIPMQAQLAERQAHDLPHGSGGKTSALMSRADPVTEIARLKRATDDIAQRDPTDDLAMLKNHMRNDRLLLISLQRLLDRTQLPVHGEIRVRSYRLPRTQELSVERKQLRESSSVFEDDRARRRHRAHHGNRDSPRLAISVDVRAPPSANIRADRTAGRTPNDRRRPRTRDVRFAINGYTLPFAAKGSALDRLGRERRRVRRRSMPSAGLCERS